MFAKVFKSMFTGSMLGAGPEVFAVWVWLLSHADEAGHVDANTKLLAVAIGMEEASVIDAIAYLESEDERSRSDELDGRRIQRLGPYSYRIVNYEHYREMRSKESRRKYQRELMRKRRAEGAQAEEASPKRATKPKAKASPKPPPPEALELAQHLYDAIRHHTPDFMAGKAPRDLERKLTAWAVDFDRLLRLDGADPGEVKHVINYCHRSADEFERPNVQSGRKVRQRWEQLRIKARNRKAAAGRDGLFGTDWRHLTPEQREAKAKVDHLMRGGADR